MQSGGVRCHREANDTSKISTQREGRPRLDARVRRGSVPPLAELRSRDEGLQRRGEEIYPSRDTLVNGRRVKNAQVIGRS